MELKTMLAIMWVLIGILLGMVGYMVIDFIEYHQMLEFERELDEAVRRTKAIYGTYGDY